MAAGAFVPWLRTAIRVFGSSPFARSPVSHRGRPEQAPTGPGHGRTSRLGVGGRSRSGPRRGKRPRGPRGRATDAPEAEAHDVLILDSGPDTGDTWVVCIHASHVSGQAAFEPPRNKVKAGPDPHPGRSGQAASKPLRTRAGAPVEWAVLPGHPSWGEWVIKL